MTSKTAEKGIQNSENKVESLFGPFLEIFSAKTVKEKENAHGGVVTAMLANGFRTGNLDTAIVVLQKKGGVPEIDVVETAEDAFMSHGTKYVKAPTATKLPELVAKGKKKIAVVGTPCQARVARRIQQSLRHEAPDVEVTVVGLFCYEAFNYERLKAETERLMGIDLDEAEDPQIQSGRFIVHFKGDAYSCNLKELASAVATGCGVCKDFSANFADISVGSAGSQNGYATVVVRTEAGRRLLQGLELARAPVDEKDVFRLCRLKRKRAEKNLTASWSNKQGNSE